MSVDAINWAKRQGIGDAEGKGVLIVLAEHADKWGICWPSAATLAKATGKSKRTVQRHLRTLEGAGFVLSEEARRADGSRSSNRRLLLMGQSFPIFFSAKVAGGSDTMSLGSDMVSPLNEPSLNHQVLSSLSRETSFEKPFDFDEPAWLEWVDYNLQEFGRVLSPTAQKKQLQTLLAICGETGETQGQVIRRSVESGWKRFHTDRYGSQQRKTSARRARREKPLNTPVADDTPVPGQKPASAVVQAQAIQREEDEAQPVDEAGVQRGLDYLARRAAAERDEAKREHLEAVVRRQRSGDGARASPDPDRETEAKANAARVLLEQQRKLLEKG